MHNFSLSTFFSFLFFRGCRAQCCCMTIPFSESSAKAFTSFDLMNIFSEVQVTSVRGFSDNTRQLNGDASDNQGIPPAARLFL